ncbi:hypothetical protein L3Q82_015845 [Scortum barcoo]|uniref:Uncharacterized protein n=1 Tax=Scortum barcoo TaxID=214431 RepID=A0ACB8VP78_9TELE|nr:hypothetical protein L3Q82_015845 [Scortum barcoo]
MLKIQVEGGSAAVTLLDWYDLSSEVILVLERPVPCVDLIDYANRRMTPLPEHEVQQPVSTPLLSGSRLGNTGLSQLRFGNSVLCCMGCFTDISPSTIDPPISNNLSLGCQDFLQSCLLRSTP